MNSGRGITAEDLSASAQANDLRQLAKALRRIQSRRFERMIDLGCGYGGVTRYVADYFQIPEVCGIDIDDERIARARLRDIKVVKTDMGKEAFPYPDGHFGLATSFGVLEHLVWYDNFLSETYRVLEKGGYFVLQMPNLGSYINRTALLLGYQPRDVEVSSKHPVGFMPGWGMGFNSHVHSAALRPIKGLLRCYGFSIIGAVGSSPFRVNPVIDAVDRIMSFVPSLSRRFIVVAQKP